MHKRKSIFYTRKSVISDFDKAISILEAKVVSDPELNRSLAAAYFDRGQQYTRLGKAKHRAEKLEEAEYFYRLAIQDFEKQTISKFSDISSSSSYLLNDIKNELSRINSGRDRNL